MRPRTLAGTGTFTGTSNLSGTIRQPGAAPGTCKLVAFLSCAAILIATLFVASFYDTISALPFPAGALAVFSASVLGVLVLDVAMCSCLSAQNRLRKFTLGWLWTILTVPGLCLCVFAAIVGIFLTVAAVLWIPVVCCISDAVAWPTWLTKAWWYSPIIALGLLPTCFLSSVTRSHCDYQEKGDSQEKGDPQD